MHMATPLRAFVDELPREQLPLLKGLVEERVCREQLTFALRPPEPAAARGDLVNTKAAAQMLDCSEYEIRDLVHRRELGCVRRTPRGRLHFEPATLAAYIAQHRTKPLAFGLDHRYAASHDAPGGANPTPPARLDAAPAGRRLKHHRNDGRPVGARRTRRHAAGRDEPYAPGAAAWSDPPAPDAKG